MPHSRLALAGVVGMLAERGGNAFRFLKANPHLDIAALTGVRALPSGLDIGRLTGVRSIPAHLAHGITGQTGVPASARLADMQPSFPDVVHAPRRARPEPIHIHLNITTGHEDTK